jgi:hypothetical protein
LLPKTNWGEVEINFEARIGMIDFTIPIEKECSKQLSALEIIRNYINNMFIVGMTAMHMHRLNRRVSNLSRIKEISFLAYIL